MGRKKRTTLKETPVDWYVEKSDTFDRSNPNTRMTGLLRTEDDAREAAKEIIKGIGPFERLYITNTDNGSYSFK